MEVKDGGASRWVSRPSWGTVSPRHSEAAWSAHGPTLSLQLVLVLLAKSSSLPDPTRPAPPLPHPHPPQATPTHRLQESQGCSLVTGLLRLLLHVVQLLDQGRERDPLLGRLLPAPAHQLVHLFHRTPHHTRSKRQRVERRENEHVLLFCRNFTLSKTVGSLSLSVSLSSLFLLLFFLFFYPTSEVKIWCHVKSF